MKEKKLLGLISIGTTFFLILFYSPIGNLNSYRSKNTTFGQGVNFEAGIENAPVSSGMSAYKTAGLCMPTANLSYTNYEPSNITGTTESLSSSSEIETSHIANYAVENKNKHFISNSSKKNSYSEFAQNDESTFRNSTKREYVSNNSMVNQTFTSVMPTNVDGTSLSEKNSSNLSNLQSHGFLSLSTDLSSFDANLTADDKGPQKALTNPGDEDPIGPTIPIPEGWNFLLFLALGYGFFKTRVKKQITEV